MTPLLRLARTPIKDSPSSPSSAYSTSDQAGRSSGTLLLQLLRERPTLLPPEPNVSFLCRCNDPSSRKLFDVHLGCVRLISFEVDLRVDEGGSGRVGAEGGGIQEDGGFVEG
jgi:hypothetical protein